MATLVEFVNAELVKLEDWFIANRLSLNAKKSFSVVHKRNDANKITINLNGNKIEQIGQQNSSESLSTNVLIEKSILNR